MRGHIPRRFAMTGLLLIQLVLGFGPAPAATFLGTLGFEDDVDLVTSADGEILVVCEENVLAGTARVRIVDLDAPTGNPLAIGLSRDLPGFEHAVDPIVVTSPGPGGYVVLVPYESRDGLTSGVRLLDVDATGALLGGREVDIALHDLGFREDVDGFVADYPTNLAFFPLESADHTVRGVIAIDVDPADAGGDGINAFGSSTLLSTDGRLLGTSNVLVDWLPGLADGVDPVGYRMSDRVRFLLPVASGFDRPDLLRVDFDGSFEPPVFIGHASVRALNAASVRPTSFPGFERDVDMALFDGGALCSLAARSILVPVEGPGDDADLYLLDENGVALWTYSHDSGSTLRLPGYQIGVDPLILCGLGGAAPGRIALPVQSSAGNADFWILNLATGQLMARAEDPARNPGLTIPGYEIGVDAVRWTVDYLALPVERSDHVGGMLVFNNLAVLQDSRYFAAGLGYVRSVDPIVAPLPDPERSLWVPVGKDDRGDSNVLIFTAPPSLVLGASDVESLNPGLVVGGLVWDVDAGFVEKALPGQAFTYVPEQGAPGVARLRFEATPSVGRYMVLACDRLAGGAPAPSLYFFRVSTGLATAQFHDLLGLQTGLDVAHGRGPATPGNPPAQTVTPGTDADTDPTLAWLPAGVSAVPNGGRPEPEWRVGHPNPYAPRDPIMLSLPAGGWVEITVVDAVGRLVRRLSQGYLAAGDHRVTWDGRNESRGRVAGGVFFLHVRDARGGLRVSKLLLY